jgi:hypothetical protein
VGNKQKALAVGNKLNAIYGVVTNVRAIGNKDFYADQTNLNSNQQNTNINDKTLRLKLILALLVSNDSSITSLSKFFSKQFLDLYKTFKDSNKINKK